MKETARTVCRFIEENLSCRPLLIAIDGRCGAGKSLLGATLQTMLDCNLVHMDDFFLRPQQRTPQRLATPGGNVDHERFYKEVLQPLTEGRQPCYRPYSCRSRAMGEAVRLPQKPITVVEGAYSCHPLLRDAYGLRIFLSTDARTQLERITARSGAEAAKRFCEEWIPLEELYLQHCGVKECCRLIFET